MSTENVLLTQLGKWLIMSFMLGLEKKKTLSINFLYEWVD